MCEKGADNRRDRVRYEVIHRYEAKIIDVVTAGESILRFVPLVYRDDLEQLMLSQHPQFHE